MIGRSLAHSAAVSPLGRPALCVDGSAEADLMLIENFRY